MQVANDVASANELPSCEARPGRRVNNSAAAGKLQGGKLRKDCVRALWSVVLPRARRLRMSQQRCVGLGSLDAGVRLASCAATKTRWRDPAGHLLSWCLPPAACRPARLRPPCRGGQRLGLITWASPVSAARLDFLVPPGGVDKAALRSLQRLDPRAGAAVGGTLDLCSITSGLAFKKKSVSVTDRWRTSSRARPRWTDSPRRATWAATSCCATT